MITLEPRAPWPWPYTAPFSFYVRGLQPPVQQGFQIVNGLGAQATGFRTYDAWWRALGRPAGLPYRPPTQAQLARDQASLRDMARRGLIRYLF